VNGINGVNGMGLNKQKPLGPRLPAGYTNGRPPYLNGHTPNGSDPASGGYAAAAAAAALAQLTSLQSAGALAGMDPVLEQQLTRLLQLQQQSGLAAQPMLDPYMEAVLEAGQALGQPNPALLPSLAPLAAAVLPPATAGLLPAAAAAATQLTQLGFDVDGLSPVATAAAASMYAPLKINGVTLDSQLLVAPFADNWDVMCAPQQLAAMAGTLNAGHVGYGVKSPRSNGVSANVVGAQAAAGPHSKHHKALPTRSGSSGSNSSNGSNGHFNGSTPLSSQPLGHVSNGKNGTAAASANSSSTAAALAAASISAAVPPIANVCSDAPWDLKKAAEEDAKVLAAQQGRVEKLVTLLERSQTLAKVRAAQAAANPDASTSDDASSSSKSAAERAQPVLFGYQLPDTGADAWGGSSSSAALDSAPGSGCISQEPSNKLFVGNIGWWVTEDDLLHWFSRFGNVVHVKVRVLSYLLWLGQGNQLHVSCHSCRIVLAGIPCSAVQLSCEDMSISTPQEDGVSCMCACQLAWRVVACPLRLLANVSCAACCLPASSVGLPACADADHVQLPQDAQAKGQVAQPGVWLHRLCHTRRGCQSHCVDGWGRAARPD
jgi:hypothetical protein